MAKPILDSETNHYFKWKIKKLEEKLEESSIFWKDTTVSNSHKIESLEKFKSQAENKNRALQEEVEAARKMEREHLQQCLKEIAILQQNNSVLRDANDCKTKELANLEQQIKDYTQNNREGVSTVSEPTDESTVRLQAEFDQKLARQKRKADRALKEQAEKHECEMLRMKLQLNKMGGNDQSNKYMLHMQAQFDQRLALQTDKADRAMKEQAKKHECEMVRIKQQLNETKHFNKRVVEDLENKLKEVKGKVTGEEIKLKSSVRTCALKYEHQIYDLKKKVVAMEELKKKQAWTVAKLENSITDKNAEITNKDHEIALLKRGRANVDGELSKEKENIAHLHALVKVLKGKTKDLEDENRKHQDKLKEERSLLYVSNKQHWELSETVMLLTNKLNASGLELKQQKAEAKKCETCLLRIKEEIQACLSDIDEPRKLKGRIINLKRLYIDGAKVIMNANDTMSLQDEVSILKKKLVFHERIQKNHDKDKRNLEKERAKVHERFDNTRSFLINVINEKTMQDILKN